MKKASIPEELSINGWTLYVHPLILDQLEKLTLAVERTRTKSPSGYASTFNAIHLAALRKLMFEVIPSTPPAEIPANHYTRSGAAALVSGKAQKWRLWAAFPILDSR